MQSKNQESLLELAFKLEKQAGKIALLEEELYEVNAALEEKTNFAAQLEQDLEHAISLLQGHSLKELFAEPAH